MTLIHANDEVLEEAILEDPGLTVVAFIMCQSLPCEHFKPELWSLAEKLDDKARVYWIDVDENPSITTEIGVKAVPTTVVFRNGEKIKAFEGPYSHETLIERIMALLEK